MEEVKEWTNEEIDLHVDELVRNGLTALDEYMNLDQEKVDYIVVDKRNEYEVICREEFKKENKYEEIFAIGKTKELIKRKAEKINKYIIENITNEEVVKKIKKLEEVLYEE